MNRVAIIDVNFVRKLPIVLVVVKLSCETPRPNAPPSDFCNKIDAIRIKANIILIIKKESKMYSQLLQIL